MLDYDDDDKDYKQRPVLLGRSPMTTPHRALANLSSGAGPLRMGLGAAGAQLGRVPERERQEGGSRRGEEGGAQQGAHCGRQQSGQRRGATEGRRAAGEGSQAEERARLKAASKAAEAELERPGMGTGGAVGLDGLPSTAISILSKTSVNKFISGRGAAQWKAPIELVSGGT